MSGMIGFGRNLSKQANAGFAEVARGETQRNSLNDRMEVMDDQAKRSMMQTAGGMGIAVGMAGSSATAGSTLAAAGPYGWAIGAGLTLAAMF